MNISFAAVEPHGSFSDLMRDRSGFQHAFNRSLAAEPGVRGRVLDIGCSAAIPHFLPAIGTLPRQLDGVDPDPVVLNHPHLTMRWHSRFEDAPIPVEAYDLAYAYNVVEHVADPIPFLTRVHMILKPGGVFWALTPSSAHPFAWLTRSIERMGLKGTMRENLQHPELGYTVNPYTSYYRLNRPGQVLRAAGKIPFRSVEFHWFPCLQWDTYFPRVLRWLPRLYDFSLGIRWRRAMQIFAFRLEK